MASESVEPRRTLTGAMRVADLLLGAAHADEEFCDKERDTVRAILRELAGRDTIPPEVEARIEEFDPNTFDLASATERFASKAPLSHRELLELVRLVCDADRALELSEDAFLVTLVLALRGKIDEHEDLVLRDPFAGLGRHIKRFEDAVLGSLAFAAAAVPMAAIAAGVKLTSKGPVFFKQRRYGLGGSEILVYKFRTMTVAEDGDRVEQATKNDARITPFGAFLRRTSLDELPQLINVLKGEMSLVGPRPHAVAHNERYRKLIHSYMLRHKIKPGISGWAQVNGWRGETDTLEKMVFRVEHDLEYIRRWSPLFDLQILFLTAFGNKVRQNAR